MAAGFGLSRVELAGMEGKLNFVIWRKWKWGFTGNGRPEPEMELGFGLSTGDLVGEGGELDFEFLMTSSVTSSSTARESYRDVIRRDDVASPTTPTWSPNDSPSESLNGSLKFDPTSPI